VGAGLGSSASFSVCAATTVLLLLRHISIPAPSDPFAGVSHRLPLALAQDVNRWAFMAEKILHGNPSGVDNSVAVFGSALAYTRPGFTTKSGMEVIQGSVPDCLRARELDMMVLTQIQIIQVLTHKLESPPRLPEANRGYRSEESQSGSPSHRYSCLPLNWSNNACCITFFPGT